MSETTTERSTAIVAQARALAGQLAANASVHDRDGSFPYESYEAVRQSGYLRLVVPEEYGGVGASLYELVLAQEELGKGDGATAMGVDMTLHLLGRLREQRAWPEQTFAMLCRSIVEEGALINAAATEAEMGSPSRGGLPATTATPTDGGWLLNGRKLFVTMAPALRYIITSAALPPSPDAPERASANFIVDANTAGLRMEDTWSDALSLRTSGSFDVVYENVFVPEGMQVDHKPVGSSAPGGPPTGMAWFSLTLSAVYLGVGQAACDAVAAYAHERVPSALGRPIATLPAIQRQVGDIATHLRAARSVLHDVARRWSDAPDQRATLGPDAALAKYLCTNAAVAATDRALRIAGGFGLSRTLPLERYFRDARAGITHPPNDEAALELIGRQVLDKATT